MMSDEFPLAPAQPPRRRSTVRRLLVFVAAFGLFFGFLAHAFQVRQWGRDRARRAQCVNHLKQIGIQLETYHQAYQSYPTGTLDDGRIPRDKRLGWASAIYLLDPNARTGSPDVAIGKPWDHPETIALSRHDSEHLFCPSLPRPNSTAALVPAAYIGIGGLGLDAPTLPKGDPRAGVFGDDRATTQADIKDGLSRTMMVAESFVPSGPWYAGGRHTVRGLDPARQPYLGLGRQFGGVHGEGANVLMADGHVRYIANSIDPKVFEAMSTIAGGETVPEDE